MAEAEEIFSTPDEPVPMGIVAVHGDNEPISSKTTDNNDGSSVIETESIEPSDAFQIFAGRAYHTKGASKRPKDLSDPIARYLRLKAELEELESDVALLDKNSELVTEGDSSARTGRPNEVWRHLGMELKSLQSRLEQVSENRVLKPLINNDDYMASSSFGNDKMDALLSAVSSLKIASRPPSGNDQPATDTSQLNTTSGSVGGDKNSAVYEFYYPSASGDDGAERISRLAALESRLHSLESAIGSESTISTEATRGRLFGFTRKENMSIQTAIRKLEERVARLDPNLINEAQEKLKPLQKALDEIVSKPSSSQLESDEAIQRLFKRTQVVDDFGGELPALVSRLRSLHSLHEHAIMSVNRMATIEAKQMEMSSALKSDREALHLLSNGVEKNMETMVNNMKAMEEKK